MRGKEAGGQREGSIWVLTSSSSILVNEVMWDDKIRKPDAEIQNRDSDATSG